MSKKKSSGNEIIDRIALIDKKFVEDLDIDSVPKEPQEFLDWWWDTYAKVCEACPLSSTRNSVVKPDGNANAEIMIVAEGPGFLEDLAGMPMVGSMELRASKCNLCRKVTDCYSQRILYRMFERAKPAKAVKCEPNFTGKHELKGHFYIRSVGSIIDGILISKWKFNYPRHNWITLYNILHPDKPWTHPSPWFITNAVLCRSTDITGLKDGAPEPLARQKCRRWLTFQWAAVQPKIILCFGRVALSVLMRSEESAKDVAPNTIVNTKFGPVLFQNHPSYFMREKNLAIRAYGYAKIASSFEKALEYVNLPTTSLI